MGLKWKICTRPGIGHHRILVKSEHRIVIMYNVSFAVAVLLNE